MKKKLMSMMLCLVLLVSVVFTGCGKDSVTAEDLITEMNENAENVQSVMGDMSMGIKIGMEIPGQDTKMSLDMTYEGAFEMLKSPEIFHLDGHVGMSLMGLDMDMEVYSERQDDEVITYMNMMDQWQKSSTSYDEEENVNVQDVYKFVTEGTELELAEETEKIGDQDVYVLTSTLNGDALKNLFQMMSMGAEELAAFGDMADAKVEMTMKVFKDSKLPAAITMTVKDMTVEDEVEGMEMSLDQIEMIINYTEYDTLDAIEIPQEALDTTIEMH